MIKNKAKVFSLNNNKPTIKKFVNNEVQKIYVLIAQYRSYLPDMILMKKDFVISMR